MLTTAIPLPGKTAWTRAAAGASSAQGGLPTVDLFGLPLVDAPMRRTLDHIMVGLEAGAQSHIAFVNAHCVNVAQGDAEYRLALGRAARLLPDGSGLALAAGLQGQRFAANLNGTDLVPLLCRRLARAGRSVFLLGGRPGVAEAAAAELQRRAPGLTVAGTRDGYFAPEDEAAVIEQVNRSEADVLLVAFGVPRQELWIDRNLARLAAPLVMGVGGLFDFMSGRIPRAPRALRRLGLEWTWRFWQEPRRMFGRYILGNPRFVGRAVREAAPAVRRRADLGLKRGLDVAVAGGALLALAPALAALAVAVRLDSQGPALFRQTRVGENGRTFTLYKFRSMYVDAEARRAALQAQNQHGEAGVTFKMKRDPRITRVGRWLRRFSLDEVPQLWNVLKGDMSLVGSRPPLPSEVARYTPAQWARLAGRPGLTGLWQVSGRAEIPFERQVEMDVDYLRRRTILLDLAILLRTVPAVLGGRGAY
ncbi:MAG: WecB/TagA/CpsF family glycosyltransferase [Dongiaceae bacterium]